ncbi:uncharacterized protein LOC135705442 [Ochlerotatus camptorhynchus]|uniref:uncharacterized protein LOC135705442 n=1 Tax=Ochlerotatus camptorhynchus TaxID=644619 RepID=UPI0031D7E566
MQEILRQIHGEGEAVSEKLRQLFYDEEINEPELFMSLDDSDFIRLKLSTKLIKIILKIQKSTSTEHIIEEEYLEHTEEDTVNTTEEPIESDSDGNNGDNAPQGSNSETNPYTGITMEQDIDINIILERSAEGRALMQILQENKKPNDKTIKRITHLLCGFLKSNYGVRASTFYKNIVAKSLVQSYPILASSVSDVPHALWFYINGRGDGKHAGKIHYHLEYLAKRAEARVFRRRLTKVDEGMHVNLPVVQVPEIDLFAMVEELKFIVPISENRSRINQLWTSTFEYRSQYRENHDFHSFLEEFPVSSAFEGELVEYDFKRMRNQTVDFAEQWNVWQAKVLKTYQHLFREISNDFLRALAIIRAKNPTRGSKRVRDEDSAKDNPLKGLLNWIKLDDPLPIDYNVPIIIVRGSPMTEGECFISWKSINIPLGGNIVHAFSVFCKAFDVFGTACAPSDKQFFYIFQSNYFLCRQYFYDW